MSNVIICRVCMSEFVLPDGLDLMDCPSCGATHSRPQATGSALEVFQRAISQRMRCDFHNAENSYQHVLLDYPEEHEALWGLALCRYGVEYVEDPNTGKHMPVVHAAQHELMQEDPDFLQACEYAPDAVRAQYERDAAYIDEAQAEIRRLAQSRPPFDVFLCHKTSRPGEPDIFTKDYERAFRLYHLLDKAGYRVFFAPMEMEGVAAGETYEAGIFHALDTARVMIVVCSDPDYIISPWVQNEWKRYLRMMKTNLDKHLLPLLYGELSPAKLPREFRLRKLQGIRMGEMGSEERLMETVGRFCGNREEEKPATILVQETKVVPAPVQAAKVVPAPVQETKVVPAPVQETKVVPAPVQEAKVVPAPVQEAKVVPAPVQAAKVVPAPVQKTKVVPVSVKSQEVKPAPAPAAVQETKAVERPMPESDFKITMIEGGCAVTKYTGRGGRITIPEKINGLRVLEIWGLAFFDCETLTDVVIPDGVKHIRDRAFSDCPLLESVLIPQSVENIGWRVFSSCPKLVLRVWADSAAHAYARQKNLRFETVR